MYVCAFIMSKIYIHCIIYSSKHITKISLAVFLKRENGARYIERQQNTKFFRAQFLEPSILDSDPSSTTL